MDYFNRSEFRKRLEAEVYGERYLGLLSQIQNKENDWGFSKWDELVDFMHQKSGEPEAKNSILLSIFQAHVKSLDSRWRTLLMLIFTPALESIHSQKSHWDHDHHERWQNIVWTFLKVIYAFDPNKRSHRLAQKIFNDTVHRLWNEKYKKECIRSKIEIKIDEEVFLNLPDETLKKIEEEIELKSVRLVYINSLKQHLTMGTITESDYLLLVGTRVYGKVLSECASEQGISYQAAKKRRQRAEAVINKTGYFSPLNPD